MHYILECKENNSVKSITSKITSETEAIERAIKAKKEYEEVIVKKKYTPSNYTEIIAVFHSSKQKSFVLILKSISSDSYLRSENFTGTLDEAIIRGQVLLKDSETLESVMIAENHLTLNKKEK